MYQYGKLDVGDDFKLGDNQNTIYTQADFKEPDWSKIKKIKLKVKKGDSLYVLRQSANWPKDSATDPIIFKYMDRVYGKYHEARVWNSSNVTEIYLPDYNSYLAYKNGEEDSKSEEKNTDKDQKKGKIESKMDEFEVNTLDRYSLTDKAFKSFVLNASSTADNIDYLTFRKLQLRINELFEYKDRNVHLTKMKDPSFNFEKSGGIKAKFDKKQKLSAADRAFINVEIGLTRAAIKDIHATLQRTDNKVVFKLMDRIKTEYKLKKNYSSGNLSYNDPMYVFLKNYSNINLNYTTQGGAKKIAKSHNFYLNSKNANLLNGIASGGEIEVGNKKKEIETAISNPLDREAYMVAAKSEAKFDGINSWDGMSFSYGHIQFAGKSSIVKFLWQLKSDSPKTFKTYFSDYGIDATATDLSVYDYQNSNTKLKGEKAIKHLSNHLEYAALFKAAAWNREVRLAQINAAKEKFIKPAEESEITIPSLVVKDKKGKTIQTVLGLYPINKFKKGDVYKKAKNEGLVTEKNLKKSAKAITTKKETRAAVYMIGIHKPSWVQGVLQLAVLKTITVKNITSISDLRNKYQKELLNQIYSALYDKSNGENEKLTLIKTMHESMK